MYNEKYFISSCTQFNKYKVGIFYSKMYVKGMLGFIRC